jgi:hypothetical protein
VGAGVLAVAADLRHFPEWDAHYTALGLVLALVVSAPLLDSRQASTRRAAASGLLWGVLLYLNATTLLVWLSWLGLTLLAGRRQGWNAATWTRQACVVVGPMLLLAPWVVRNRLVFEQWIPLRSNLGLELAVSFNDCARAGLVQNLESGCFARTHPDSGVEQAARLARLGEPRYHAERRAEAVAWIRTHPREAAALVARRMALFWLPSPRDAIVAEWWRSTPPRRYRIIVVATLLSLAGLWRAASGSRPAWLLLPAILALYPLVHYLLQFEDRYRYPVLWVTLLLAGRALTPRPSRRA